MKKTQFKSYAGVLTVMMMLVASSVYASKHDHQLDQKRKEVVHAYLDNLEHANPSAMDNLFVPDGQVVSTSQGHVNAHQFFFDFLPLIETAKVDIGDIYQSMSQQGRYSAGFHFSWVLKDGSHSGGHYVDEFVFAKHTAKLKIVYMYENSQM